jgi:hypothetical protein
MGNRGTSRTMDSIAAVGLFPLVTGFFDRWRRNVSGADSGEGCEYMVRSGSPARARFSSSSSACHAHENGSNIVQAVQQALKL